MEPYSVEKYKVSDNVRCPKGYRFLDKEECILEGDYVTWGFYVFWVKCDRQDHRMVRLIGKRASRCTLFNGDRNVLAIRQVPEKKKQRHIEDQKKFLSNGRAARSFGF